MLDDLALFEQMGVSVARQIEAATAPLRAEIADLRGKLAVLPEPVQAFDEAALDVAVAKAIAALPSAPAGEPGKDADIEQIKEFIAAEIAALPAPKNGKDADEGLIITSVLSLLPQPEPGPAGKDADPAIVDELRAEIDMLRRASLDREQVDAILDDRLAALPAAESGKDGVDGKDADPEFVRSLVAEAVAEIPRPQDGKSVTLQDVAPLIEEAVQRAAVALPVPKDGVGVAGALIDRSGALVLTLTDGSTRDLGQVVGKDGQPGVNGRDGVDSSAPDAIEVYRDPDNGLIEFKFVYGEIAYAVTVQGNDGAKYRGVYQAETQYLKSDIVTWGGSAWHCNEETVDRPGEGSKAWTLMVKKGRDGKDGSIGAKGDPGKDGRDGRGWT